MFFIAKKWRLPKLVIAFFVVEFAFTIPALVLFALADPDEYRTRLWQDGSDNGFNSSPSAALYEAANYRPVVIPLVWSEFITKYNVVISVLITFLMLVKAVMFILHLWFPLLSFLVHGTCMALFAYSARVQTMSDMTDPAHPQPGAPWYITKSCSVAHFPSNIGYCRQAKASFAVTIILVIVFACNTAWAAYCMWPTKEEREEHRLRKEEEEEEKALEKWDPEQDWSPEAPTMNNFEMSQFGTKEMNAASIPLSPTTPRTMAFRRLGGNKSLPLRI